MRDLAEPRGIPCDEDFFFAMISYGVVYVMFAMGGNGNNAFIRRVVMVDLHMYSSPEKVLEKLKRTTEKVSVF